MKAAKLIPIVAIFLLAANAHAQGTFQNLDFEQANPVSTGNTQMPNSVTAASAFPFWTVTIGGVQQTQVEYNDGSLGAPAVVLLGPPPPTPPLPVIDGNYSVLLTGSFPASIPAISQTGLIPSGTESLLFEVQPGAGVNGTLIVMVGTQTVPISAVGTGANYTLYGANISAWAGDTEQLTFEASQSVSAGLNNWVVDDISFSPEAVAEPTALALTGIGGLLFALYRRFAPKGL